MATQIGLTTGEVIPLGEFTATQDQQGGWTATREYYMLASTFSSTTVSNQFKPGTFAIVADSTIPAIFNFLVVESRSVKYGEAGTCTVTVNYAGAAGAQYDEGDLGTGIESTYRLEGRIAELELTEHPKWKDLTDPEKYALGELFDGKLKANYNYTEVGDYEVADGFSWAASFNALKWSDNTTITLGADAQEFARRISAGIKTYLSTSITWTETTQGNEGMTASQLNLLSKVATPRGNPPNVSGDRNWLLTSASQEQRGELYQTTIEWTLSEREGWDSFLYS